MLPRLPATIWTGDPGGIDEDWKEFFAEQEIVVVDKGTVDYHCLTGAVVIDDDPGILAMAVRKGAIAVPADQAKAFFTLLGIGG